MEIRRFIREYKPLWTELDELLLMFEGGRKRTVAAEHIDRLTRLYKTVSGHLAYSQTNYPKDEITTLLNQLVSRAHHSLHSEQWKGANRIGAFFKTQFVGHLLERRWFIAVAALLFLIGGVSGFAAVQADPLNLYALVPASIADNIDPEQLGKSHESQDHGQPVFSSTIMTNNIRVAVLAFASGITFGLMTVYLLLQNGILLGALAAVFMQAGNSYAFWAYILPHGIIELTAIFIAGGAGLYMGYRMMNPGPYTRKYMFLQSVRQSALLLVGTIPLFVIAGIIEGYITPSALSLEVKYIVAGLTLLALALYVLYGSLHKRLSSPRSRYTKSSAFTTR
ncbi:stage II sporulation protein M [Paenibacillus sp. NEAU-GSW1]|uniref:stage II sporulation protein M n=1 Tax=Paenibacillus sp. NEAU-GSW1 TaxID=2682486 RepID=UPI0012E1D5B2|nr:stage II sporulation protein M [Paenibacillus sp. NEAU-GSW1]MUT64627.1 stage II sporulation protein M [Paenibacillus sp. NEAU-GSW1]